MVKKTKKAKTDSRKTPSQTIERRRPYQKAAIRSHAFARAILNAASYSLDPISLRALFEEAAQNRLTKLAGRQGPRPADYARS